MESAQGQARRLVVIFNPTAGARRRRRLGRWLHCLDELGAQVTVRETIGPRHAEELARTADPAQFDAVVAAGGDGTINEVVNGLSGSVLPLAILPLGTANVLAAEIGLPQRIRDLAHIAAFARAQPVWPGEAVSDGVAVGRRFLIMAGIGFDAEVVEQLDLALKRRIGKLAYVASILRRLRDYRPSMYRAVIDGVPVEGASLIAAKSRFYGGRFVLAPAARLSDPSLQVVLFGRAGRGAALGYMAAMAAGRLRHHRSLRILPAKNVRLDGPHGAAVQIDGDIHVRLPVTLRIAATPLHVIQP